MWLLCCFESKKSIGQVRVHSYIFEKTQLVCPKTKYLYFTNLSKVSAHSVALKMPVKSVECNFSEVTVQGIITLQKLNFTADIFVQAWRPVNFEKTNICSSHLNNAVIGNTVTSRFSSISI